VGNAQGSITDKLRELALRGAPWKKNTVYNVVFTGKFTVDEKTAVAALAVFFRQGRESARRLLQAGKVLKSYDDREMADKLVGMLALEGVICRVDVEGSDADNITKKQAQSPGLGTAFTGRQRRIFLACSSVVGGIVMAVLWIWFMPPVVKGTSFDSYEASVQKVINHAPIEKRRALHAAVDYLTGSGFEFHERNTSGGNEQAAANLAYGAIRGMNADAIIQAAEAGLEVKRKGYRDEIETLQKTLADEEAEIAGISESNKAVLSKIELGNIHFSWDRSDTPQMDMKLVNNSGETITRVYLQAYLYAIDGRLVVSAPASYTAAGIPPLGTHYLTLYAKEGDPWMTPQIKANWHNLLFQATIENAENIDGKLLGTDLRPYRKTMADNRARLVKLQRELGDIRLE